VCLPIQYAPVRAVVLIKHVTSEVTFNKAHEAWHYFQQLTGALDRDSRPEPLPLNEVFLKPRTDKRKPRPRGCYTADKTQPR
jgi:hypothetical protein